MRAALIHNPDAGGGIYTPSQLARLFADAGCDTELFGKKKADIALAIAARPDVLIVAGGDGTVAKAVLALHAAGSEVPLYILPLGTANNIAFTLGIRDTVPLLVQRLYSSRAACIDVGCASGPWGSANFVEAAGVGFIGRQLLAARRLTLSRLLRRFISPPMEGEAEVRAAARGYARIIRSAPAREVRVRADGADLSGRYIAVEAMNIAALGPRITVARNASPSDSMLDLVLLSEIDREPLARALEQMRTWDADSVGRVVPAATAEISWLGGAGHLDDEPWPERGESNGDGSLVRVALGGAVKLWLPA